MSFCLVTGTIGIITTCNTSCWRRRWHPTPVPLPGKSHGWMSLVGCSPRGREESDMTERLHFHFSLSCIGEGNGNPLHCSCLENPRDGRAWWAAVYGVAQSRTRLKRFSSSSRQHLEKLSIWRQPRGSNPGDVITRQTQTKGELLIRYIAIKTNPCTWKRDAIPCMNN